MPSGKKAEVKLADQGDGRQTGTLPVTETGLYRLSVHFEHGGQFSACRR